MGDKDKPRGSPCDNDVIPSSNRDDHVLFFFADEGAARRSMHRKKESDERVKVRAMRCMGDAEKSHKLKKAPMTSR